MSVHVKDISLVSMSVNVMDISVYVHVQLSIHVMDIS
jgi:hypothetical protein